MNYKRVIGLLLVGISVEFFLFNLTVTGAVIGGGEIGFFAFLSLLGILVFLIGSFVLFMAGRGERRTERRADLTERLGVDVFIKNNSPFLIDPGEYFGKSLVSLEDFKAGIRGIQEDPELMLAFNQDDQKSIPKLMLPVKHGYTAELTDIEDNPLESEERREAAGKFLDVLFPERHEAREMPVLISEKAIRRTERDAFVRAHLQNYLHEIDMIRKSPFDRPQGVVGGFRVSPKGESKKGLRVAWHLGESGGKEVIFIDDVLYHQGDKRYVNDWHDRAEKGEIAVGKGDYHDSRYRKLEEALS